MTACCAASRAWHAHSGGHVEGFRERLAQGCCSVARAACSLQCHAAPALCTHLVIVAQGEGVRGGDEEVVGEAHVRVIMDYCGQVTAQDAQWLQVGHEAAVVQQHVQGLQHVRRVRGVVVPGGGKGGPRACRVGTAPMGHAQWRAACSTQ